MLKFRYLIIIKIVVERDIKNNNSAEAVQKQLQSSHYQVLFNFYIWFIFFVTLQIIRIINIPINIPIFKVRVYMSK